MYNIRFIINNLIGLKMKKVAILGVPNVGKSSIFNRILSQRDAIISDVSGTTRDIKKRIVTILEDYSFELIDTGGINDINSELPQKITEHALKTSEEADILLFLVNGKDPSGEKDRKLFYKLEKLGKPILLVVNKIDNEKEEIYNFTNFTNFGAKKMLSISVSHNRNMTELYKWLILYIPKNNEAREEKKLKFKKKDSNDIRVSIVGRVNTGKSSLLNAILQEERSVVSSVAGTTIDPIDEEITFNDRKITFIDTAGLRRRSQIEGIEKYALYRTEKVLKETDIVLLIIDVTDGVVDLDEKIANIVDKYKLGCLIIINKWDIKEDTIYEDFIKVIRRKLKFLSYAAFITISAKTGKRVDKIMNEVISIFDRYKQRIPTAKLNEIIKNAVIKHNIPSLNGAVVKIKFSTQYETSPPKIALIMNRPKGLHFSYKRYLVNTLRENFDFEGVPINIVARKTGNPYVDVKDI